MLYATFKTQAEGKYTGNQKIHLFYERQLTKQAEMSKIIEHGDLSEWFKVRCWKRRVANTHHEFESHSLRHS